MDENARAEAIRQMMMTEGWTIVETYITQKQGYHREQLMICETMDNIIKHRASIKVLHNLNVFLRDTVEHNIHEEGE